MRFIGDKRGKYDGHNVSAEMRILCVAHDADDGVAGAGILNLRIVLPGVSDVQADRFGVICPNWRLITQVDCLHEMRPMAFLDPRAFVGTNVETNRLF